ncbi:hypothetical protein [Dubosiella newyorkensis]|jgi:hypothetical protein|uniref:hypothetical protein n=1 Tax=Dubosiella newyorkensis TaxID=1862672 RepID=UPI002357B772|nr:hypothetical protein [Dubosiella newyorkensis]MCI9040950.1 hypothetical protein [Dubosiella newyorkensis]
MAEKVDIGEGKVDIDTMLLHCGSRLSTKTKSYARQFFDRFGWVAPFDRSDVMKMIGLKKSGASKLLSKWIQIGLIRPVSGFGKGKYTFNALMKD